VAGKFDMVREPPVRDLAEVWANFEQTFVYKETTPGLCED